MIWFLPVTVQGVLMIIDEFYFHRKRGLPNWEVWGHPLDNISVIICLSICIVWPDISWKYYLFPAIVSCLCVTKDEWVHAKHCTPVENWIHSLLFVVHPIVLWSFYKLAAEHLTFLFYLLLVFLAFLIYQIVFWGLVKKSEN